MQKSGPISEAYANLSIEHRTVIESKRKHMSIVNGLLNENGNFRTAVWDQFGFSNDVILPYIRYKPLLYGFLSKRVNYPEINQVYISSSEGPTYIKFLEAVGLHYNSTVVLFNYIDAIKGLRLIDIF